MPETIYCIEGHWNHALGEPSKVEDMLRSSHKDGGMPFIRRNCATLDEMHFWLSAEWALLPMGSALYFAAHGAPGQVRLSEYHSGSRPQVTSLSTLAAIADVNAWLPADGCLIHFGTCQTLDVSDEVLDDFMIRAGASVVSGFTQEVGFATHGVAALALEMQFFSSIGPSSNPECRLDLLGGRSRAAQRRRQHLMDLGLSLKRQYPDCGFRLQLSPEIR